VCCCFNANAVSKVWGQKFLVKEIKFTYLNENTWEKGLGPERLHVSLTAAAAGGRRVSRLRIKFYKNLSEFPFRLGMENWKPKAGY